MRRSRRCAPSALLFGLAAVLLAGCDQRAFDAECDVVVLNESACPVAIYVDGRQVLAVKPGAERTFTDVGPGRHVLEALDAQGRLVQRRSVELATGEDFYWTLESC